MAAAIHNSLAIIGKLHDYHAGNYKHINQQHRMSLPSAMILVILQSLDHDVHLHKNLRKLHV